MDFSIAPDIQSLLDEIRAFLDASVIPLEAKVAAAKKELSPEEKAEQAAAELIKAEEREKSGKKAFSGGGVKKGFFGF